MYVYDLRFHNFHNDNVKMYVWDGTTTSRAYSNACSAQNRNNKVALTWMLIAQSSNNNIKTADHRFLVSGHSFLSHDRDFGNENKKLHFTVQIFHLQEDDQKYGPILNYFHYKPPLDQ
uniref:Uncharacterized protein n=1 Tax=Glossina morsitans morsitans TaxID=37546 RepID=A0A1B0FGQ9_GLOMM